MRQAGPHIEDKLLDFAYGELAPTEAQVVEAHLKACTACTQALGSIQGVRRVMSRLPVESAPATGLDSLLGYAAQAARRQQAGPAPKPVWWRRWLVPVAGLGTALVIVGVIARGVTEKVAMPQPSMARSVPVMPAAPIAAAEPSRPPMAAPANDLAKHRAEEEKPYPVAMKPARIADKGSAFFRERDEPRAKLQKEQARGDEGLVADDAKDLRAPAEKKDMPAADPELAQAFGSVADIKRKKPVARADGLEDPFNGAPSQMSTKTLGGASGGGGFAQGAAGPGTSSAKVASNAEPKTPALADSSRYAEQESNVGMFKGETTSERAASTGRATAAPAPSVQAPPPMAVATAPTSERTVHAHSPSKQAKAEASGESQVDSLDQQAQAAHRAGDYPGELKALKDAVAVSGFGASQAGLLERLCEVEEQLNYPPEACDRLQRDYPNSPATQVMVRRRARQAPVMEMDEAAPGPSKASKKAKAAPPAAASEKANSL